MIHLFRHAHAGKRTDWDGADEERPLTERGRCESLVVADRLAATGVARILTSPYLRCVQSVRPLSETTGLSLEIETALEEGADPERTASLLAEIEPGTVLCSHGDVIAALIEKAAAEGAELAGELVWEKGSLWHLETGAGGRIRSGRYEPPPITAP